MTKRIWLEKDGIQIALDDKFPVTWRYMAGGKPSDQPLMVSSLVDNQLLKAGCLLDNNGPWSLNFDSEHRVNEIYFTRRSTSIGRDGAVWHMTDVRSFLRGVLVDCSFNRMRQINDFDRPNQASIGQQVALFNQVPKRQFMPNFCRTGSDPLNANFVKKSLEISEVDYEPWTALSALIYFLRDDGYIADYGTVLANNGREFKFVGGKPIVDSRVRERKILIPPGYNTRGSWQQAIDELSRMARVMVYPNENGQFVVASTEPTNDFVLSPGYSGYSGSDGTPTLVHSDPSVPRVFRLHIPEWLEIRWDYDERYVDRATGGPTSIAAPAFPFVPLNYNPQPITTKAILDYPGFLLLNVAKAPQDTARYKKGMWAEFFTLLGDWSQDVTNFIIKPIKGGQAPQEYFNPAMLRYGWMTPSLVQLWLRDRTLTQLRSLVLEARVATAYNYYRRYFKIPDFWMDYLKDFRPITSDVFSTTARTRQPSPFWIDYHAWDTAFARVKANNQNSGTLSAPQAGYGHFRNLPLDNFKQGLLSQQDAFKRTLPALSSVPFANWTPAPGEVIVNDTDMGVLHYMFNPDLGNNTVEYGPGLGYISSPTLGRVSDIPAIAQLRTSDRQQGGVDSLGKFTAFPDFRFSTILSCLWLQPNNPQRFFTITKDGRRFIPNANGPIHDHVYTAFEAFRRYEEGKVYATPDPTNGVNIVHGGEVANLKLLEEVAEGEAHNYYWDFYPLVLGYFTASGWTQQLPVGQFRMTEITSSGGFTETGVLGTPDSPRPSVWEFLSPSTRELLAKIPEGTLK